MTTETRVLVIVGWVASVIASGAIAFFAGIAALAWSQDDEAEA